MECPTCHQTDLPADASVCPHCGADLVSDPTGGQIKVQVKVGQAAEGARVTGVRIEQMGYTAADVRALLADIQSRFTPQPFTGESPYVGLEAFSEEDARRFFGRERLVAELLQELNANRFLTVAGPSGSGKSSLVRAGLIPKLKQGTGEKGFDWTTVTLRPGRDPIGALGRAAAQLAGKLAPEDDLRQKGAEDASMLARWVEIALGDDANRRALLVVDQFEEIFTQTGVENEPVRSAFLEQLIYAASQEDGRAVVLITLRSDFISNCAAYPRLNALLNEAFRQVGPMSPDELVSAIVRPALEVGVQVDPKLVEQVVMDVGAEPGALPLMQFALKDLFDYEKGKGGVVALTLDGYIERGGLRKALERYADRAFESLTPREQELARSVFSGLVVPGRGQQDTRRTALFDELVPQGAKPGEVETVIYKLASARLLTTEDREDLPGAEQSVTLAHERLLEAWPWLHHLVEENREAIQLTNQLVEDAARWQDSGQDASYLYTGARLATAEEGLSGGQLKLPAPAQAFITAGIEAREASRRSRRRLRQITFTGLAAAALLFAVLAGLALIAQRRAGGLAAEAEKQAKISRSGETALLALSEQEEHRADTALLLAAQSYEITPTVRSYAALLSVLQDAPRLDQYLTGHQDFVLELAYSPDGRYLASAGCAQRDLSGEKCLVGDVRLWDAKNGHPAGSLRGIDKRVRHLAFSPDATLLAAADENGGLWLFDSGTRALIAGPVALDEEGINQIVFSPDGRLIYASGKDHLVEVWDAQARVEKQIPLPEALDGADNITFSPDGRRAAVKLNGQIEVWQVDGWSRGAVMADESAPQAGDLASGQGQAPVPEKRITGLAGNLTFSDDGALLAGTFSDNSILIWNAETGEVFSEPLTGHTSRITRLAFSPDGRTLASADAAGIVRQWDVASWSLTPPPMFGEALRQGRARNREYQPLLGHTDIIQSLAFSPDGRLLASGGRDLTVRVWDWAAFPSLGEPIYTYPDLILGLSLSPNGKLLAFGSCQTPHDPELECEHGVVVLLDAATGRESGAPLEGHTALVTQIAFSPDGSTLASAGWDKTVRLWDMETRQPQEAPLEGHTDFVTGLAFNQDGSLLASTSRDGSLRLWDVAAGTPRGEPLRAHDERIVSLALSADGRWAAAGYRDGQIVLWDLQSEPAASQALQTPTQVNTLAFNPDGSRLAAGLANGQTYILWKPNISDENGAQWQVKNVLSGHSDRVSALAYSQDGYFLATGSWDHKIVLWDTNTERQIAGPLDGHTDFVSGLVFSPDGLALYSAGRDDLILRWGLNWAEWQKRACDIAGRKLNRYEWLSFGGQGDFNTEQACKQNYSPDETISTLQP